MTEFKTRLTKPEKDNPYYNTISNGGWSPAIKGSPTDSDCDVLSNCVGYALGRFNEIGGDGFKYLRSVNAENFIQYKGDCTVGDTPKLGACIVWRKGPTFDNADGDSPQCGEMSRSDRGDGTVSAGHVAIVEEIISNTEIITSESGWNCTNPFWTQRRRKGDGNWGQNADYTFLGFIYNPALDPSAPQLYRVRKSADDVKSQIGAFASLRNAVAACKEGYAVFDTNGDVVYAAPHRLTNTIPYPFPAVTLSKGLVDDSVKWLQTALTLHGFSCGIVDGVFGIATESAVKAYQTIYGLPVTGRADEDTLELLKGGSV